MNLPIERVAAPLLATYHKLFVKQKHEMGELFGFETRNKYEVLSEAGQVIAYSAEQQKGFLGFLARQFLGHWRSFEIFFFTPDRKMFMKAIHPFRFFFQRLEIEDAQGKKLGALQQRFAILSKKFDIENESGMVLFEVSSPLWKPWTFPILKVGQEIASVKKKWSGGLTELFTDKDNFAIEYNDPSLSESHRLLILAAAMFVDLQYFERKASSN